MKDFKLIIAVIAGLCVALVLPVLADTTLVRGEGHNAGDAAGSWSYGDVVLVGSDGVNVVQNVGTIDDWEVHFLADTDWIEDNITVSGAATIDQGGGTGGTYGTLTGAIDGSNLRFDTSGEFVETGLRVYLNGGLLLPNGDDYTIVDSDSLNFVVAPLAGSRILLIY